MTDAELDRLEALFRNPPSASGLAEHGLALITALRAVKADLFGAHQALFSRAAPIDSPRKLEIMLETGALPPPSAPTPPQRPKKGGK